MQPVDISGIPPLNDDHVPDPDGLHIYLSANDDWQIYRARLTGGAALRVSQDANVLHFLHGVSPDGTCLAFVGVRAEISQSEFRFISAEICTIATDGSDFNQLTENAVADGPDYSADVAWIYYNTESFSGHTQIARMRPDGSGAERMTHSVSVDWFPHLSHDGTRAAYYPTHPEPRATLPTFGSS